MYTDELRVKNTAFIVNQCMINLFKFSDDMALVGLLYKEQELSDNGVSFYEAERYFEAAKDLQQWCQHSHLQLNAAKTKELIVDFNPKLHVHHKPVFVSDKEVEIVDDFIYLGTTIDKNMNFHKNAERIFKKANQRLFLLRKLRSFGVSKNVLQTVYKSIIQSILTFNITVWHGNMNQKEKKHVRKSSKDRWKNYWHKTGTSVSPL